MRNITECFVRAYALRKETIISADNKLYC